jgi:hypothetical protein
MVHTEILKDSFSLCTSLGQSNAKVNQKPSFKGILYEVVAPDDGFGNPLLKKVGENTVVVGGAITSLEHLCGVSASWRPKTLNDIYGISATASAATSQSSKIALFGVGTGGSGLEFGSIIEKDVKRRDVPDLIPLRAATNLTGSDASLYYFRKTNSDGTYYWYLKEFSTDPVIKTCWKDAADDESDGTEVTDDIADSSRTENLQTFAEFVIDLNTSDVREYYEASGALDQARYNSIGLYIGDKVKLSDGRYEYANVRLFSYLNIDNKSVKIKTASQYVYRVLSLV